MTTERSTKGKARSERDKHESERHQLPPEVSNPRDEAIMLQSEASKLYDNKPEGSARKLHSDKTAAKLMFRSMHLDDLAQIQQIEREAFTSPWTKEAFMNELKNNLFARYVVMELDNEIIGYGGMWTIMDEAHVTNIAVQATHRGQGFGERLLHELQVQALQNGCQRMTLEVRVSNEAAQGLYRKMGFEPAGVRPRYYADNQEDALIMWAEL